LEGNLLDNKIVTINAKGLVNSLRGEDDGICFFGIEKDKNVIKY